MAKKEKTIKLKIALKLPEEPVGWIETKLPKSVMKILQSYIETAKKNPINWNHELAGNISKSLLIEDKDNWFFETILTSLISKFMENYPKYLAGMSVLTENAPFYLDKFWVNFQKENEFNPIHDHGGVFSFVIWVKIPTDWREQHALPFNTNSNSPCASDFAFYYTTMLGATERYSYLLEKEMEEGMLFFPAKLNHIVYPFYNCDKDRISISGNIRFDISENSMRQFRSQQMKGKDVQK